MQQDGYARKIAMELERYRADEAAGLLLRLPVPLGTTVWCVRDNPACHYGVRQAEIFLFGEVVTPRRIVEAVPFTLSLLEAWGKTVFLAEAEGRKIIEHDTEREGQGRPQIPEPKEPGPGSLL
ncbi:hypothetical protein [Intestinimonas timonensis]|uniref:hypothetical protein n=1 Tax=Intestinimonas timonensis TaxID=1689270 RepID=UPI003A95724E